MARRAIGRTQARTISVVEAVLALVLVGGTALVLAAPGFETDVPDVTIRTASQGEAASGGGPVFEPDIQGIGMALSRWDALSAEPTQSQPPQTTPDQGSAMPWRYLGSITERTAEGVRYHALLAHNGNQRIVGEGDTFDDVSIVKVTPEFVAVKRNGATLSFPLHVPSETLVGSLSTGTAPTPNPAPGIPTAPGRLGGDDITAMESEGMTITVPPDRARSFGGRARPVPPDGTQDADN
jgi:hypothetical protein